MPRLTCTVKSEVKDAIADWAAENGLSMSELCAQILMAALHTEGRSIIKRVSPGQLDLLISPTPDQCDVA